MNIVLLGYGKMGKIIEQEALKRGHIIVAQLNSASDTASFFSSFQADAYTEIIAIDFTEPSMALGNIKLCLAHRIPLVIGTTGWYIHLEEITKEVKRLNGALFYASNFSLGVHLFNKAAEQLASIMSAHFSTYAAGIEEIHHTQKLDAPSGTAITLAERVLPALHNFSSWHLASPSDAPYSSSNSLPIIAKREEGVPGTHELIFSSEVDVISIKHLAHNRLGFAQGAVIAAEFLLSKKGIFTMRDLLG